MSFEPAPAPPSPAAAPPEPLQAPFPWFGGKSTIAPIIWERLGTVSNYVEPFFGSGACLLARPQPFQSPETINDADGFVANFWRALAADPAAVAHHADWPVNEVDLHARHAWLVAQRADLTARLLGDPAFYDPHIAGWWVWGLCSWIGSGWCSGQGPWRVIDGRLVDSRQGQEGATGQGINRKLPHLGDAGRGINRQLPHLGAGQGINRQGVNLPTWFDALAQRLRRTRVCCGDWSRVLGDSVTIKHAGITAVLLDPPYADTATRAADIYAIDSTQVAHQVREWAIAHGDHPRLRIALCGYDGEHDLPPSWSALRWKANGGFGNQGASDGQGRANRHRETVWFSPHCLGPVQRQPDLFHHAAP